LVANILVIVEFVPIKFVEVNVPVVIFVCVIFGIVAFVNTALVDVMFVEDIIVPTNNDLFIETPPKIVNAPPELELVESDVFNILRPPISIKQPVVDVDTLLLKIIILL